MQLPNTQDTIVAVSTAWQPASVGIVRISGPGSVALARRLGLSPPTHTGSCRPRRTDGAWRYDADSALPATVYWFRAPRSYTGQDVVEIHTVGCLPVLRELSAGLIEMGARRALPGEFTARAFINGKIAARQVEGVLALMQSASEAGIRQAARLAHGTQERFSARLTGRIADLLALIEAGIDFVEEEHVRFITPAEATMRLDELLAELSGLTAGEPAERCAGKTHVALVGLPNAGKSALFNALAGHERAIVSPVLGTTRDVLSVEIEIAGHPLVLQDCAGLRDCADDLELAAHLAAERTAQQADLVVWVHAADQPWQPRETEVCAALTRTRAVLVISKRDLGHAPWSAGNSCAQFSTCLEASAHTGAGISALRDALAERAGELGEPGPSENARADYAALRRALERARALTYSDSDEISSPELLSLELRAGLEALAKQSSGKMDECILERIFAQFCIGK